MDGDLRFWTWIGAFVTAAVITLILSITTYYISVTKHALDKGYEEGAIKGCRGAHWVKTRDR